MLTVVYQSIHPHGCQVLQAAASPHWRHTLYKSTCCCHSESSQSSARDMVHDRRAGSYRSTEDHRRYDTRRSSLHSGPHLPSSAVNSSGCCLTHSHSSVRCQNRQVALLSQYRDALSRSAVSFNSTKLRAQSFIVSYYRFITARD